MLRNRYDRTDLFALVPQLGLRFEPQLEQLDRLLDDDEIFDLVRAETTRPTLSQDPLPRPALHPGGGHPPHARGHAALPLELRAGRVISSTTAWSSASSAASIWRRSPTTPRSSAGPTPSARRPSSSDQRPGRPARPVAEGDPRPQAPRRHHGGGDRHPLPHRQRPDRRRRPGGLAAAASGPGPPWARRHGAEGGVPQPGPLRPQAVAAAAPDRPPQERTRAARR